MIKVNLNDGKILKFDLDKSSDRSQWIEWSSSKDFQNRITGIGILHNRKYHTLQYPKRFTEIRFFAESVFNEKNRMKRKLGERIVIHADQIKLELLVYTYEDPQPPIHSRTTMTFIGKQMFKDFSRRSDGSK